MVMLFWILLVTLPSVANAVAPTAKDAVELILRSQKKVNSAGDPICANCVVIPNSRDKDDSDPVCDDLFEAACMKGPNEKQAKANHFPRIEVQSAIKKGRELAAKAMGYLSVEDAVRNRLREEGFDLKDSLSPNFIGLMTGEGSLPMDEFTSVVADFENCQTSEKRLENISIDPLASPEKLQEILDMYESYVAARKERLIAILAKDIPSYFSGLKSKCDNLTRLQKNAETSLDSFENEVCSQLPQHRRTAVDLFRNEDGPGKHERSENFVRSTFIPANVSPVWSSKNQTVNAIEKAKRNLLINYGCNAAMSKTNGAIGNIISNLLAELSLAKPTVDSVLDAIYSENRKQKVESIFRNARREVTGIVSSFIQDKTKRDSIISGYEKMEMSWIEKPPSNSYTKNRFRTLTLDSSKEKLDLTYDLSIYALFNDSSLSYFTTENAFYTPAITMARSSVKERISFFPATLMQMDENPNETFMIIAHELSHKVGPRVIALHGIDLTAECLDLMECFRSPESIRMRADQEDETIADSIAAESLARHLLKVPLNKRRAQLTDSIEFFCRHDEKVGSGLSFLTTHPENSLRVSGIFGANPSLRSALGCAKESLRFKSCGISSVKLGAGK